MSTDRRPANKVWRIVDDRRIAQAARAQRDHNTSSATVNAGSTRDVPTMQFHDLAAHVQTDTGSSRHGMSLTLMMLEPEELFEDPRTE